MSQAKLDDALADLRSGLLSQVSSMIQPVSSQVATNIQTIQSIARIERLDNLIVANGDFRGGKLIGATNITSALGTFDTLSVTNATTTNFFTTTASSTNLFASSADLSSLVTRDLATFNSGTASH